MRPARPRLPSRGLVSNTPEWETLPVEEHAVGMFRPWIVKNKGISDVHASQLHRHGDAMVFMPVSIPGMR